MSIKCFQIYFINLEIPFYCFYNLQKLFKNNLPILFYHLYLTLQQKNLMLKQLLHI